MDNSGPEKTAESTAIVTAQQYSREIRKAPALPPLTKEGMGRAAEMAKDLNRSEDHLDDIVTFGNDAQGALAQITRDMLDGVRLGTLDEVMRLSDNVLAEVRTVDIADLVPAARRVLLILHETTAAIEQRIKDFFRRYQRVNTHLDRQEAEIFAKEAASTDRYYRDKALAKSTLDTLLDAQVKATAIKMFLGGEHGYAETQRRLQALAAEKEAAKTENRSIDYLAVDAADRHGKYIERLEMKAAALQQLMVSAYQMNVTIRMMGDSENIIRQKLSDIRTELLPQWRGLIAIAYHAYQQQGIAQFVANLSAAESALRRKTADQLEKTAEGVADIMTRPVIDVVAMRDYHEKLTNSLDKLKTASIEAKKIRDAAESEMQGLINQMGEAAATTSLRKE